MLSLKFYIIVEFQKCWSLFWLVYTCKICLLLLVLCQGQIHIVKEFLLSKSKNEIDFFATINQQPQVLIIGTHVIRLYANKTDNEFMRNYLLWLSLEYEMIWSKTTLSYQ